MDYKGIEELIKTMSEAGLSYLELEVEGMHLTMKKENIRDIERIDIPVNIEKNQVETEKLTEEKIKIQENEEVKVEKVKEGVLVRSPIVGTFYASSDPKSGPLITIGSRVKKGDKLCIIEAMKLMNEIESEIDGDILEIFVQNEQMVEYGEPLFRIG